MSSNAGKRFLQGFQPNFENSYSSSYRYNMLSDEQEKQRQFEDQQKRLEEEKKTAEQQKSMETVDRLLRGGYQNPTMLRGSKPGVFVKDNQQTQMKISNSLSAGDFNKYQDIKKNFAPEQNEYTGLDYSNKDAVWGFNKRTQRLEKVQDGNPIYKQKKVRDATGYNASGEKTITEWYEDGSNKVFPTGYYKKFNSEGKAVDVFDVVKFNKVLDHFTDEDVKRVNLTENYLDYKKDKLSAPPPELIYEINAKNQSNAATLYSLMDDESRGVVNSFYDQLKGESSKRGIDYTQFERQKQTELKKKFQIKVGEMFKNSDGSSEAYAKSRALILYSKFKFSYAD